MTEPRIAQRAPYVLPETPCTKWWCACGHSQSQPFCDGSHKNVPGGFTPIEVQITEAKKIAWCGCKHSGTKPYCDGSHKRLP